jgi:3-dehydroquinate synthase
VQSYKKNRNFANFFDIRMIISDLHSALEPYLKSTPEGQVYVLVDSNTEAQCIPILSEVLSKVVYHTIVIGAGEANKSLSVLCQVWDALLSDGATRDALLINLGGGMVTDLGGLAAATYMRGIRYLNIPTSLLAMVDASAGGKTGINYSGVKNLVGCFAQPLATWVYMPFLETLPIEELLSGYAEMLKHGLLDRVEHWHALLCLDWNDSECSLSSELLALNMAVKEGIVSADPKEKGERKLLNFGHTIGHAIEESYASEGRAVRHGYCVLWGMVAESYLSVLKLGLDRSVLRQLSHLMLAYYGRPECDCRQRDKLVEWMRKDKKNKSTDAINFTLLRGIGDGIWDQVVTQEELDEALEYLFRL